MHALRVSIPFDKCERVADAVTMQVTITAHSNDKITIQLFSKDKPLMNIT